VPYVDEGRVSGFCEQAPVAAADRVGQTGVRGGLGPKRIGERLYQRAVAD
jgi:hypothetical protein